MLFASRSQADPIECGWEPIATFLANPRFKRSTRYQYRSVLRQWYGWLIKKGYRVDNPVDQLPRIRATRGLPRPISTDQLGQALNSGRFYSRTRTMILLAAYEGLRAHEIAQFRGEQIRGGRLWIVGKGDEEYSLPVHALIAAEAQAYPRIGLWFTSPTDRSQPITAKNVSNVVGKALRRADVDATCHQIRHWYGTHALRAAGGNLRVAQELLRHASPATTAIYTLVDDLELRAAIDALPVPLHLV
jgi:integrase/recombinase XerD